MAEFFENLFGNGMASTYGEAILSTLKVTVFGTLISYLIGLPLGIILYGTSKKGIFPQKAVNTAVGIIVNILRSVPFVILLVLSQPIAKFLIGTKLGDNAFIIYLVIAAAPFVARMVESSLKEVDKGVIEAAKSMGATNLDIIFRVMLVEARTSLIMGATIAMGTILGYSAMAGTVGGGGLGDIAVRYGYYRWQTNIMIVTVILIIILFQIFQTVGMKTAGKLDRRK